jgi:flagellar hook-associated protein 1 FlgK
MGGDLTQALRIANSGLLVGQQSLDVVARNIANVNTPGFSRKVINLEQQTLAGHGAGVKFGGLSRRIDQSLMSLLRRETGTLNQRDVQTNSLDRLQQLFGTPESNTSISHMISELQASIEALSVTPQDVIEQQTMVRWGSEVASLLRRSSLEIQDLRREADSRIGTATNEINSLLQNVNELNIEIVRNKSVHDGAADLEDQRDQALDRLAKLMDVYFSGRPSGEVVVFTAGGRSLVDSSAVSISHISAVAVGASVTQAEGDFDGIYAGERIAENDITQDVRTGELKGLIEMRDTTLPALQSALDELSARLRDVVNAVHNRGAAYPGLTSFSGTRVFDAPTTEQITFSGTDDTAVVLFDSTGREVARTTVRTLVGGATTTIENLRAQLDAWTPSAALGTPLDANFDADGKLTIDVKVAGLQLAFRDQSATAAGSSVKDAAIAYDPDGAGAAPSRSYSGFSSFFGLNDFYVDATGPAVHETPVLSKTWTYSGANTTLSFRHNGVTTAQAITNGDSLETIASALQSVSGLAVALIPDGAGVRLSVSSADGEPLMITEPPDGTGKEPFLAASGLKIAATGSSSTLAVRSDILATPSLVSRGRVQWDGTLSPSGEYVLAPGDSEVARELATSFSSFTDFGIAGRLGATRATFAEYASSFISDVSVLATTNRENAEYQSDLVASLQQKSDSMRGVNLDEEVSGLMLYEQAYSAAARVITVVQQMFDALDQAVR